jgi:hypothetical protein
MSGPSSREFTRCSAGGTPTVIGPRLPAQPANMSEETAGQAHQADRTALDGPR